MTLLRHPVRWENAVVGHIVDPWTDMFDLVGRWEPSGNERARAFITALRDGEEPLVHVGDGEPFVIGTIAAPPAEDGTINIRSRPEAYEGRRYGRTSKRKAPRLAPQASQDALW